MTTTGSTPTNIPNPLPVPIRDALRTALLDAPPPEATLVHHGLTALTAVTLAWLDTLAPLHDHPTDDDPRKVIRTTLIDLLSTDQHPAASPATLTAVRQARQDEAERSTDPETDSSVGRHAPAPHRHAALSRALGLISTELHDAHPAGQPDPTVLHTGLTTLAAIALAWLDTLPTPDTDPPPPDTLLADLDTVLGTDPHARPQVLLTRLADYKPRHYQAWTLTDLTHALTPYGITPLRHQGRLVIQAADITRARTHHPTTREGSPERPEAEPF